MSCISFCHQGERVFIKMLTEGLLHEYNNHISDANKKALKKSGLFYERVMGIEPTWIAWKAIVLPLNYTRLKLKCNKYFCMV